MQKQRLANKERTKTNKHKKYKKKKNKKNSKAGRQNESSKLREPMETSTQRPGEVKKTIQANRTAVEGHSSDTRNSTAPALFGRGVQRVGDVHPVKGHHRRLAVVLQVFVAQIGSSCEELLDVAVVFRRDVANVFL